MAHRFPPPNMRFPPPPPGNAFQHHIPRFPAPFFPVAPPLIHQAPLQGPSEREADEAWARDFLRRIGKDQVERKQPNRVSIREAVAAIDACTETLAELEDLAQDMAANIDTLPDDQWEAKSNAAEAHRAALSSWLPRLPADSSLAVVKAMLNRRARRRRRRVGQSGASRALARANRHAEIDERLAKLQGAVEAARTAEQLSGQAALVLEGVTRRQHEARSQQALLDALLRLRRLRAGAAGNPGNAGAEAFESALRALACAWSQRAKEYAVEETGLRVMLDHAPSDGHAPPPRAAQAQWRRAVFGAARRSDATYTRADNDLDAFVAVRRDWDQFVVDGSAPMSSCIPIGWVLPAPPSSPAWAELLSER